MARGSKALPYTIEDAVDDELAFWRHITGLIDQAVEKGFVKRGLTEAIESMRSVQRTQKTLIERVNQTTASMAVLVVNYDRLVGLMTVRQAEDDILRAEVRKLLDAVTPHLPSKTPPNL